MMQHGYEVCVGSNTHSCWRPPSWMHVLLIWRNTDRHLGTVRCCRVNILQVPELSECMIHGRAVCSPGCTTCGFSFELCNHVHMDDEQTERYSRPVEHQMGVSVEASATNLSLQFTAIGICANAIAHTRLHGCPATCYSGLLTCYRERRTACDIRPSRYQRRTNLGIVNLTNLKGITGCGAL